MLKSSFSLNKNYIYHLKLISFYLLFFSLITNCMAESSKDYAQMTELAAPFRKVAEKFIYLAQKSDKTALKELLAVRKKTEVGEKAVEDFISNKILPYFREFTSIDKSVNMAHGIDSSGNQGFVFFMYLSANDAENSRSPFVIYVVEENGRLVITDVIIDFFVRDRHLRK
jgi:hypothetical protein